MLRISLLEEIGSHQSLTLEKLKAATSYVRVLSKYFIGSPRTKLYLRHLHSRLKAVTTASSPTSLLPIRHWIDLLKTNDTAYGVLPPKRAWNRCKGSAPKYRGYPCAVWTTFHAMSVAAAVDDDERLSVPTDDDSNVSNSTEVVSYGTEVLDAMVGYMRNFFGCRHCARHFGEMVANSTNDVSTYDDVVLWLWEAHNRVNRRLEEDATEDPKAPKIQFPGMEMCVDCRVGGGGGDWNRTYVLGFLKRHFSYPKLKIQDDEVNLALDSQNSSPCVQSNIFMFFLVFPLFLIYS